MTTSIVKKRCYHCNKKIKLMEYTCRCDEIFCQKCRMPESHECKFDYKNNGKIQLAISYIGIDSHYNSLSRGVIDSRDIIYFLSLNIIFIQLTSHSISKRR